jgi:predicted esterase
MVAGFSMGGGLALHLLRQPRPAWLAGIFTAGSFLSSSSHVYTSPSLGDYRQRDLPILMTHGESDELIPIAWGEQTHRNLTTAGLQVSHCAHRDTL